jgi:hypothetical protein
MAGAGQDHGGCPHPYLGPVSNLQSGLPNLEYGARIVEIDDVPGVPSVLDDQPDLRLNRRNRGGDAGGGSLT